MKNRIIVNTQDLIKIFDVSVRTARTYLKNLRIALKKEKH